MYLRLKALSTPQLSDALDACGVEGCLLGIQPLKQGTQLIGPAYTVEYSLYEKKPSAFQPAANYIDSVPSGSVVVIDNKGRNDCTTWGDLLTQAALVQGIKGTVVHGAARDLAAIRASNYPLFCTAVTMRSGKNRVYKSAEQVSLTIGGAVINPGDFIVGDDNGVLVIPLSLLEEVVRKAENIVQTEEKIAQAIQKGIGLEKARDLYRYEQPWLEKKEEY